jgi:hypothetical protein
MRTAFKTFASAAVFACVSATGSLQVNAADDADAKAKGQGVTASADSGVPSKTDSADTAFKKLDRSKKGYVTLEDVAVLPGFATAFTNADSTHLGRLNLVAFTRAWSAYVEGKN